MLRRRRLTSIEWLPPFSALVVFIAFLFVLGGGKTTPVVEATYNPSVIKSIQYGSISMADGGVVSATATITAVDVNNAVVVWLGHMGGSVANANQANTAYLTLTNSTTVTADRAVTTETLTVKFMVLEFRAGTIKSNQQAAILIDNTSSTATITAVTVAKTALFLAGYHYNDATAGGAQSENFPAHLTLTNSTTVTGTRGGVAGILYIRFTALEFK